MIHTAENWVFYTALFFTFFGLLSTYQGLAVTAGGRNAARPEPLARLSVSYDIVLTAGLGQLAIAGICFMSYYGLLQNWLAASFVLGALYALFSIGRAFSLHRIARRQEAGLSLAVCLLINFLWPLAAVLIIPVHIIDLRNTFQRGLALRRTAKYSYIKERS